jgi:hypothetical protein
MRPAWRARRRLMRAMLKRLAACFSESKFGQLFVACMLRRHLKTCATGNFHERLWVEIRLAGKELLET